jgi:hypothetical protein
MLHLTKPKYLRDLFVQSNLSFANALIVIAGELTLGVLQGIALGVVLSLLKLIYRTSHPQEAMLGQLPSTEAYRDVQRHPEAITFPGLLCACGQKHGTPHKPRTVIERASTWGKLTIKTRRMSHFVGRGLIFALSNAMSMTGTSSNNARRMIMTGVKIAAEKITITNTMKSMMLTVIATR